MAGPKRRTDDWAPRAFSDELQKSQPHVFSPFLWTQFFLLMGLGTSGKDSAPTVVAGILGGVVTFPLNISVDTEIEHVTWNGFQKALALADSNGKVIFMDRSYQGRLNIIRNYSLSLNNLTLKDAGPYNAQINQKNSEVTVGEQFILHIYEQLREPRVTMMSVNASENTSCNVTLTCFVEGTEKDVQYSWTPRDPDASEFYGGSTLTISWTPCDPDLPYTCTAKNPVSQSSSHPVHAWQFCRDPGASRGGSMGETVVGVLGESVTLPLALPASQDIENVVWMFNTSIISKERGEAAKADPPTKFEDPDKNTMRVSGQDYSLKIGWLKMEDAGPYHAYICSKTSGVTSTKHVTLLIYRRLKKPKVTWSLEFTGDGICRVSLTCSVEDGGHNVTYRWTPLQKEAVVSQGGSHLQVSLRRGENHPNFTCTASNPVSNSSRHFLSGDICPGLGISRKLWIGLSLIVSILLCFGISGCCIWKQKGSCSARAISSSQVEASADTSETAAGHSLYCMLSQGYEKMETPPKTVRQQPKPTSDSSSDSDGTTVEDEETTEMYQHVNKRDQVYDLVTQEDTGHDSTSEEQAEYDLVTPDDRVPVPVVEGDTVYMQVFLDLQGKTPLPQKKESSATIYSSVQKSQTVVPLSQQNDFDPPESPTYENFT
ncbi:T-lymphocyte surface antigen Ly-9-like isoform X1 [Diceros bicornis minor]|uniref:T-lymphocyte surface antigen Ly-9-like isoform X1 n=1 Tax=Diceros bicornis minor TaxID=77932 RepID=UPI0026EAD8DB|nr:T-lymphocyte surface antigen Ly-9-like isoform X1 [Diceros bicornis minor]